MGWKIVYAKSVSGRSWVKVFIDKLEPSLRSNILKQLKIISQSGPYVGPPVTKKITANLFELRIIRKDQIRILFTINNQEILLLHAFIKKTQKLTIRDINTARRRIDS